MSKDKLTHPIGGFVPEYASVEDAYVHTIDRLSQLYSLLQPENTATDFQELIFKPIANSTDINPAVIQIRTYSGNSNYTYPIFMNWIAISCAHCIQAHIADEANQTTAAWSHAAKSQYYLGLIEGTLILEPALEHVISARSTSGARKRDQKYEPIRDYARELALKKYYPSKRQAALSIKGDILTKAKEHGLAMSEMQAERTITGWLEGMTFGGKRDTPST
jgi:hypothetical protein